MSKKNTGLSAKQIKEVLKALKDLELDLTTPFRELSEDLRGISKDLGDCHKGTVTTIEASSASVGHQRNRYVAPSEADSRQALEDRIKRSDELLKRFREEEKHKEELRELRAQRRREDDEYDKRYYVPPRHFSGVCGYVR